MTKKERDILKAVVVDRPQGLFSPADLINGIAQHDRRAVENLVARGYLEEVPQDQLGHDHSYSINFYRATEKGLTVFAPFYQRAWFGLKNNTSLYVGISSIVFGILTISISTFVSRQTIQNALEANKINKQTADFEYENAQPFLIITGGNEDATEVKIRNAGGGPAKNIFFLKHYMNASGTSIFVLTKNSDIKLGLASGQEGNINLNERFMDRFDSKEDVLRRVACIPQSLLRNEPKNWMIAFYENIRGEKLASKFSGLGGLYTEAVDFLKLSSCQIKPREL
ncbi:MAG: hypothetical protein Q7S09_04230 [bacterium]|nr:hypothetical protein [bacterium]